MIVLWWRFKDKLHCLLFKAGFPICNGSEGPCFKLGKRRRLNTAYIDDERNFSFQCKACYDLTIDHYDELWKSIY